MTLASPTLACGQLTSPVAKLGAVVVATVLVVEDERKIRELVGDFLRNDGYTVLDAATGHDALAIAREQHLDLIVLDLDLPDMDGTELTRQLREHNAVPIVMLTARSSEDARVNGLRAGADDYVVKPFSPRELVARVSAVLRRSTTPPMTGYGRGALSIDLERREVIANGHPVELTRTEFDLLAVLVERPGRVWSRGELLHRVQGYDFAGYDRTIDAHVKNLRGKLRDDPRRPRWLLTVPGVGYKFGAQRDPA